MLAVLDESSILVQGRRPYGLFWFAPYFQEPYSATPSADGERLLCESSSQVSVRATLPGSWPLPGYPCLSWSAVLPIHSPYRFGLHHLH